MARSVYTELLAHLQNFHGTYTYTVSPGFRVVLRDLDFAYDGGLGMTVRLLGSAGQTIWRDDPGPGGHAIAQWRGRQVIDQGNTFQITTTDGADVTVSGYVLTLP